MNTVCLYSVDHIDLIRVRFPVCLRKFPRPLITGILQKVRAKEKNKVVMNFSVTGDNAVPTLYPCIHNTGMPSIQEFEVDTIWWSETEARSLKKRCV